MPRRDKPQIAPRWLKWILIAFIAYAVYLQLFAGKQPEKVVAANGGTVATSTATSPTAEIRAPMAPGQVKIGGDIAGAGEEALCGQQAKVRSSGRLSDGTELSQATGEQALTVGLKTPNAPWASGVIGMKVGGIREVLLAAGLALPEEAREKAHLPEDATIQYRLELLSLSPSIPRGTLGFRATEAAAGGLEMIGCGDRVQIDLVLWGPDGAMLYASPKDAPLTFIVGGGAIFYGLDRGLLGMHLGGTRSLVVPPAYQSPTGTVDEEARKIIEKLPKNAIVLADVTLRQKLRR